MQYDKQQALEEYKQKFLADVEKLKAEKEKKYNENEVKYNEQN
jgi:cytochrome c556